jgi:hypothetical protein
VNSDAVIAVSALVAALTQIAKWSGLPDRFGPIAVLILAALGTAVWAYSANDFRQETTFAYVSGWAAVSLTSAGIFGFTRASASAVAGVRTGSGGAAGGSPTTP